MKTLLLICFFASNAMAWNYVYEPLEPLNDDYVTANLIQLSKDAEQNQIDKFFKKLGCWTESMGSSINVVCNAKGQEIKWLGQPQIDPEPALYIMVPNQ